MATAVSFTGVHLSHLDSGGEVLGKEDGTLRLQPLNQTENFLLRFFKDSDVNTPAANAHLEVEVFKDSVVSGVGSTAFLVNHQKGTVLIRFEDQIQREVLANLISNYQKNEERVERSPVRRDGYERLNFEDAAPPKTNLADAEKHEEAKLMQKYPTHIKPSSFLQKKLNRGQKYFDSGDYNMQKQAGGRNRLLAQPSPLAPTPQSPQATQVAPAFPIPTVDSMHLQQRKASISQSKLAEESATPHVPLATQNEQLEQSAAAG